MAVKKPEDLQKENEALRKENAELRNRNEILMIQNLYLKKLRPDLHTGANWHTIEAVPTGT